MSLCIGDTVKTQGGKVYVLYSFFQSTRAGASAILRLLGNTSSYGQSHASLDSLSLVRSRELSLAYHYAAESDREKSDPRQRAKAREFAAYWLSRAEERNDDSRGALCIGSDRILELEAAS